MSKRDEDPIEDGELLDKRECQLLMAALNYAYSNLDDLNECLSEEGAPEGSVKLEGETIAKFTENEMEELYYYLTGHRIR